MDAGWKPQAEQPGCCCRHAACPQATASLACRHACCTVDVDKRITALARTPAGRGTAPRAARAPRLGAATAAAATAAAATAAATTTTTTNKEYQKHNNSMLMVVVVEELE